MGNMSIQFGAKNMDVMTLDFRLKFLVTKSARNAVWGYDDALQDSSLRNVLS